MPNDSRLPRVLHVLLHLDGIDKPVTSELIGKMLNTNPSLVRRTMGGLRNAGLLNSTKGHHGGWSLAKPLEKISLADVYAALGAPNLFSVGQSEDAPQCLLEKAANVAIASALTHAHESFLHELQRTTVAELVNASRDAISLHQESISKA